MGKEKQTQTSGTTVTASPEENALIAQQTKALEIFPEINHRHKP